MLKGTLAAAGMILGALAASGGTAVANEYPTDVVADYVIGCMVSNGENAGHAAALLLQHRYSLPSILPYDINMRRPRRC